MKWGIIAIITVVASIEVWQLVPKYPDGHEHVTLRRLVFGTAVHGIFKVSVLAERLGLINESASIVQSLLKFKANDTSPIDGIEIEHTKIKNVPVVIFRPQLPHESHRKAIVYFHGGGFVIGSPVMHFPWTLRLAKQTNSIVISVDYRLAPQNPYPAAVEDCLAVTKGVFEAAESLGIDKNRIAVAGDSAGGNLAAVTALELANAEYYRLKAQILISPALVAAGVSALPSYAHYSHLFMLHLPWFIVKYAGLPYTRSVEAAIMSEHHVSVSDMNRIIKPFVNISSLPDDLLALIPDRAYAVTRDSGANEEELATRPKEVIEIGKIALDQRAWPLIVEDEAKLASVAPALVQVCSFDPLRDEGLLYFNRLRNLGVRVSLSFLRNAVHAEPLFRDITGAIASEASLQGLKDIVEFVNDIL